MKLTLICLAVSWIKVMGAPGQNFTDKARTARHIDTDFDPYTGPYSAYTLSEAFSTFRDPFMGGQLIPDFDHLGETSDGNPKVNCATDQCRGCARIVLEKVLQAVKDDGIGREAEFLWRSLNLNETKHDWECDTSLKQKQLASTCESRVPDKDSLVRFIRSLSEPKFKLCTKEEYKEIVKKLTDYPVIPMKGNHSGRFVKLMCRQQGQPLPEDSNYMQICSSCHGFLILEKSYRPKIIRSIRCEQENSPCLSGHGQCVQTSINMNVFKEGRHKRYRPILVKVDTACIPFLHAHSGLRDVIHH